MSHAPLAHFITDQNNYDKELAKLRKKAKIIYDKYINSGQKFIASGEHANTDIVCKITRINPKTQSISWKQCNLHTKEIKPASGKWPIQGIIQLNINKIIMFLDD